MFLQALQFFITRQHECINCAANVIMKLPFPFFNPKNLLHQFCYCQNSDIMEVSIVLIQQNNTLIISLKLSPSRISG